MVRNDLFSTGSFFFFFRFVYLPLSCRNEICRPWSCWRTPWWPSGTCRRGSGRACRNTCGRERPRSSCSAVRWSELRLLLEYKKRSRQVKNLNRWFLFHGVKRQPNDDRKPWQNNKQGIKRATVSGGGGGVQTIKPWKRKHHFFYHGTVSSECVARA